MVIGGIVDQAGRDTAARRLAVLLDLAEQARRRGDYRAGSEFAREGAVLAESCGDGAGRARALRSMADQLLRLGEHEEAITACTEALVLLEAEQDDIGVCETLTVQAIPLTDLGMHQEALEALARARAIAQQLGDRILLYWVHNRTGVVHGCMGDHARSTDFLMQALTMVDGLGDEARFCVFNNLGDNAVSRVPQLRAEGDQAGADKLLADALGYVEAALGLARAAAHPYREAICLDNFGMLLALDGGHDRAFRLIDRCRALAVTHGYRSLETSALQHLAQIRLMRGECRLAIEGLLSVVDRALEAGELPMAAAIHCELSAAYERIGDFAAALHHYRSFHELERATHNDVTAARARMMIHHFELDNARLEADNARLEAELQRIRSDELEADKRSLQRQAIELDRHAHEDALTGLANRRFVDVRLPEMTTIADEHARALCIAIIDVDFFKDVNDQFGHLLGDEVLRQVAGVLRDGVRGTDFVARFGGEEFLIAFDGAVLADGYRLCDQLRTRVAGFDWETLRPGLSVTISIGLVERLGSVDHRTLLALADARLYDAKRNGRNRVEAG